MRTTWYKWSYSKHGAKGSLIRRYRKEGNKVVWETLPKAKYKGLSQEEIEALLAKLNKNIVTRETERFELNFTFINKTNVDAFEKYLRTKANSPEHIDKLINCLYSFPFKFFLHTKKLSNPNDWKRQEEEFSHFLLSKNLSPDYTSRITQVTNRFIEFLHNKYPDDIRLFKLSGIGSAVLKKRVEQKKDNRLKYISWNDFKKILKGVNPKIRSQVVLAYFFGLRRSEVLGLTTNDVFEDSLTVERQLVGLHPRTYDLLKNYESRQVPYWNLKPETTYSLIESMEVMHPDTLGYLFALDMKCLGLPFRFHDLRRTFITNALRRKHYRDVQLAVGHSQIKTTELYAQDDRKLNRKRFRPKN